MTLIPKTQYVRNKRHLQFVSTLPCVITGKQGSVQACHIRSGNSAGMGLKSGDNSVLPMDYEVHARQHAAGSEVKFWEQYGGIEKARELANALFVKSGQPDECLMLIARFKRAIRS